MGSSAEGPAHGGLLLLGQAAVDAADLVDELTAKWMLEVEDLVERPMEVIGHVRDLLVGASDRVRKDPPGQPPPMSTENSCWQAGHATAARVVPSWLMRR